MPNLQPLLNKAAIPLMLGVAAFCCAGPAAAEARVEKNVVYGMYSGLALLMDVHYPEKPNGLGVVFVSGSGWTSRTVYDAPPLKEQQIDEWGPSLLRAGHTVFAINHRATPRFHYPAPVEDVQRAVRFVRHGAKQYGIDPAKLGGVAGSSGGHLIGLVAMLGASGLAGDADAVNREPATLQCVVLRAAPTDLQKMIGGRAVGTAAVTAFVGRLPTPNPEDQEVCRAASPISHVSASSPPTLLLHGDADDTVPFQQSVAMEAALRAAKVPVKLVRVVGGAHGPNFGTGGKPHAQFGEVLNQSVAWLDQYLKGAAAAK
ncbi:MAG: alpha/beta hydrolase [Acidobacteriota bacterium]